MGLQVLLSLLVTCTAPPSLPSAMLVPQEELQEQPQTEIGVGTTGFGIFFILFGVFLYFDSVLLAFGNLLFLTGLSLIIGLRRTLSFFFQRHKLKGTSFFLGGIVIVLLRWPLLGMFLETYGFFSLFKGFFPVAFGFLGNAFNIPFLSALFQRIQGTSSMV